MSRALWVAVLRQALADALITPQVRRTEVSHERRRQVKQQRMVAQQADGWLRSGGKDFRRVCTFAGLDPDAVRDAYLGGRVRPEKLASLYMGPEAGGAE